MNCGLRRGQKYHENKVIVNSVRVLYYIGGILRNLIIENIKKFNKKPIKIKHEKFIKKTHKNKNRTLNA